MPDDDCVLSEKFRAVNFGDKRILVGTDNDERFPAGSRVIKVTGEAADAHRVGSKGTVVGALCVPNTDMGIQAMLWVDWDDLPGVPVAIADFKIKRLDKEVKDVPRKS